MANPYDTLHDLIAYCGGLERRLFAIKAQCAEWERVFGHLGDTPDECGNVILAASEEREQELKSQIAKLRNALICMTKPYKSISYAQWPAEMHLTLDVLEETE